MAIKKIDSTTYLGAAERYIRFSADFEDFVARNYNLTEVLKVDLNALQSRFRIKGFTFGNYTTQEERYIFMYKLSKQLEALAQIKGSDNLGYDELIIGLGADGRPSSAAHYNPRYKFININRGRTEYYQGELQGEDAIVHEYGHFLDFIKGRSDNSIEFNAASETVKGNKSTSKKTDVFRLFINDYHKDLDHRKFLRDMGRQGYYLQPVEIFARAFETHVNNIVMNDASFSKYRKFFSATKYNESKYYPKSIYPARSKEKEKMLKDILNANG